MTIPQTLWLIPVSLEIKMDKLCFQIFQIFKSRSIKLTLSLIFVNSQKRLTINVSAPNPTQGSTREKTNPAPPRGARDDTSILLIISERIHLLSKAYD